MFAVRSDATAGQRPPQAECGACLLALHPLRRPVPGRAVLQAEDQRGGLVVPEQFVVPQVRREHAGHGGGAGQPVHDARGQFPCLPGDLVPSRRVEDLGDQRPVGGVQGCFLFEGGGVLPREEPRPQFAQRAPDLKSGVGRGGGQHRGARQPHRRAGLGTAPLVVAAVRPEAAVREAQGLHHGDVESAAFQAQRVSERTQPLLDLLSGLALSRFLAEEDDHLLGLDASALAARDQPLGQLPGGGGPVVPVLGDAEPGPAAEPAPSVLVVQGDQDDAVLGVVAEQIGQGVGEFGGVRRVTCCSPPWLP